MPDSQQETGYRATRSPGGVQLSQPTRDRLVQYPPYSVSWHSDITGGASNTQISSLFSNPDGSALGINTTVPAGGAATADIWVPFRGSCFGVRWRRAQALAGGEFSVAVDGQWVGVPGDENYLTLEGMTNRQDDYAMVLLADDLDPKRLHHARIRVVGHPTSSTTIIFYGWLLDMGAGYRQPENIVGFPTTAAVPTVQTEIPTNRTNNNQLTGIKEIHYTNTTAGALTVTIQNAGVVMRQVSVPANGDATPVVFTMPVVAQSTFTHATTGAGVNFTVLGPAY